MRKYYVYITTNANRTVLYTGVTNNLPRRLSEHEEGKPGSFVAKYNAYHLLHYEEFQDIRDALAREKEIKAWRRAKKERLIGQNNPHWIFLNDE